MQTELRFLTVFECCDRTIVVIDRFAGGKARVHHVYRGVRRGLYAKLAMLVYRHALPVRPQLVAPGWVAEIRGQIEPLDYD